MTTPGEDELWRRLRATGCPEARNELVELHLPLVRRIAERLHFSLAGRVDTEELFSAGLLGLLDALGRYQPSRQVPFAAFAQVRIRGAMLDDLRDKDWVPRAVRESVSSYRQARENLRQKLGRLPDDDELRGELGVDETVFQRICANASLTAMVSLQELGCHDDESISGEDWLSDPRSDREEETSRRREIITEMLRCLPERQQSIVVMYFADEMTLKEIGKVLRVTEGRVSQILSATLAELREKFRDKTKK